MPTDDFKILLVEDEPLLQFVFEQQMKKLGLEVHTIVGNGQEAIDSVLANRYHLVFMDVRLPILDGLSATEMIRKAERESGRYTPIVGLTAFAQRGKCLRVGMDDFLQKPIILEELEEVIAKWKDPEAVVRAASVPIRNEEAPLVHPQDFERISNRLSNIKDRIGKLRQTYELDRVGEEHGKEQN